MREFQNFYEVNNRLFAFEKNKSVLCKSLMHLKLAKYQICFSEIKTQAQGHQEGSSRLINKRLMTDQKLRNVCEDYDAHSFQLLEDIS